MTTPVDPVRHDMALLEAAGGPDFERVRAEVEHLRTHQRHHGAWTRWLRTADGMLHDDQCPEVSGLDARLAAGMLVPELSGQMVDVRCERCGPSVEAAGAHDRLLAADGDDQMATWLRSTIEVAAAGFEAASREANEYLYRLQLLGQMARWQAEGWDGAAPDADVLLSRALASDSADVRARGCDIVDILTADASVHGRLGSLGAQHVAMADSGDLYRTTTSLLVVQMLMGLQRLLDAR